MRIHKALLCFTCLLWVISLSAEDSIYLDIFITEAQRLHLTTEANTFYTLSGRQNQSLSSNSLQINVSNRAININHRRYTSEVSLVSELPIRLNDIEYTGTILLSVVAGNQIRVINRVDLEEYVAGVIAAEIGGSSPLEALKAQAVATRTMTIAKVRSAKHREDGYDLCNTVHCQVYRGLTGQTAGSYRAATETAGQVLLYNGRPVDTVYSSHCGGLPENSGNLWSVSQPYFTTEPDQFCINAELIPNWNRQFISWERAFTARQLEDIFSIRNITGVSISEQNSTSRVNELMIKTRGRDIPVTGQYEIRNRLSLPSTLFTITQAGGQYIFSGSGYGHGVGMCQTGAIGRANAGHTYQQILGHYFPNTILDTRWLLENADLGVRN